MPKEEEEDGCRINIYMNNIFYEMPLTAASAVLRE
jgi:hypothetical protein